MKSEINIKVIFIFIIFLFVSYFCGYLLLTPYYLGIIVIFILIIFFIIDREHRKIKKIYKTIDEISQKVGSDTTNHVDLISVHRTLINIEKIIVDKSLNIKKLENYRSHFLSNASHELKTPLFVLEGYLDTLLDGAINDSNVNKKFLLKIKKQTNRLNTLLGDLIQISMLESEGSQLKLEKINLMDIITNVKDTFKQVLQSRKSNLIVPDEKAVYILADKKNMEIVFNNLINNAINYSDSGDIIISLKYIKKNIVIRIIDQGIGISKDNVQQIFERFYRVDSDRSRETGGTGLGLAIVKHILLAHNIEIKVDSKVNMGTEFIFEIPVLKN